MIKEFFKYISAFMKSYAYTKICIKTGMTPVEIDLYKDASKSCSKLVGQKLNVYLFEKGLIKPRKPKAKVIDISQNKSCKTVQPLPKQVLLPLKSVR